MESSVARSPTASITHLDSFHILNPWSFVGQEHHLALASFLHLNTDLLSKALDSSHENLGQSQLPLFTIRDRRSNASGTSGAVGILQENQLMMVQTYLGSGFKLQSLPEFEISYLELKDF